MNVRSVEWRYGEEQIAMTDLLDNIDVYFSDNVHKFGNAKSTKCL